MKTLMAVLVVAVAATAMAQQTNTLDTLRQANEKQQQSVLEQYGGALDAIMADMKKKGDLDSVLILQAEQRRFAEEKTVPTPADAKNSFCPAAEAYCKSMVTSLRQYMKALDELIKREVTADRIEEAKLVKAEKDRADFMLADIQSRLPQRAAKKAAEPKLPRDAKKSTYLADLPEESVVVGFSLVKGDLLEMTVNGAKFEHSVHTHPPPSGPAKVVYNIGGKGHTSFRGEVGIADSALGNGAVQFIIYGDGKKLWQSQTMTGAQSGLTKTGKFDVSIRGVKKLELEVDSLEDTRWDHAIWIDPVLAR